MRFGPPATILDMFSGGQQRRVDERVVRFVVDILPGEGDHPSDDQERRVVEELFESVVRQG